MESPLEQYVLDHTSPDEQALTWIEHQTFVKTHYPQMLSGRVKMRLLRIIAGACRAGRILEIGTFTGYSAAAFALALPDGGHIDTYEINDEMETLIREGWRRAGVEPKITLHIGDALKILPRTADVPYDMAYIDANKREYPAFFEAVLPLVRKGGLIVVDDTLMGGKVVETPRPSDAQTEGLAALGDLLRSDSRIELVTLPLHDGLTIARKLQ